LAETKPVVSIENVVASVTTNCPLDLDKIKKKVPDVNYDSSSFPGAIMRLKSPKTSVLIFRSGNMVCAGAKSEESAIKAVHCALEILKSHKFSVSKDPVISIENIVCSVNLGGRVHIEQAARVMPRSMYEPEQFPGLIHRVLDPKTVNLIFASGKLVCTGGKSTKEVFRSILGLHSVLEQKSLMIYD